MGENHSTKKHKHKKKSKKSRKHKSDKSDKTNNVEPSQKENEHFTVSEDISSIPETEVTPNT